VNTIGELVARSVEVPIEEENHWRLRGGQLSLEAWDHVIYTLEVSYSRMLGLRSILHGGW
jgi:hypothetical protein